MSPESKLKEQMLCSNIAVHPTCQPGEGSLTMVKVPREVKKVYKRILNLEG